VNQQQVSPTDSLCLPIAEDAEDAPDATPDARERTTIVIATIVLYAILAWVSWPSLGFQVTGLGDEAWLDTLRQMSFGDALLHVGASWWRPGETALLWLIANSTSLLPWRVVMLAVLLLTTAYLQYDGTVRAKSQLDGFGAALGFSLNPTTLTVICWLSAAHISFCAVGLLTYVAFARRALETQTSPVRYALCASFALAVSLAFYELALFAPLYVLGYQWLLAPRPHRQAVRYLYGGSLLCVLTYLGMQAQLTELPRFWEHAVPLALLASSMRYVMWNFYLWANPFGTFGVSIPDQPGGHEIANLVCFGLVALGLHLTWYFRKRDPLTAAGGLWFLIFLAPVGTFLHFEGSPVAEQHLYIPVLGVVLGGVRMVTRFLENTLASIRSKPMRVVFELSLSVFLLWSFAPLVAECKRTVAHWSDARELYLTSLQNYPTSSGALDGLTHALTTRGPQLAAPETQSTSVWKRVMDVILLEPKPQPAHQLLAEGRDLLRAARYQEASSALARALATSVTTREQLDSGKELAEALAHVGQQDRATALLQRLEHDHPGALH
jgi:hypothetical protein